MIEKKGDTGDILLFLLIIFFLAVSFLVTAFTADTFRGVVMNTSLNSTDVAVAVDEGLQNMSIRTIQRGFVAIFAFLIIGVMASSFLIRVHPIWLFLYIFILAFAIFLAAILGNAYQAVTEAGAIASIASQQTMMNWIMNNIVKIMVGVGALSIIVVFAKIFTPGGYQPGGL